MTDLDAVRAAIKVLEAHYGTLVSIAGGVSHRSFTVEPDTQVTLVFAGRQFARAEQEID